MELEFLINCILSSVLKIWNISGNLKENEIHIFVNKNFAKDKNLKF